MNEPMNGRNGVDERIRAALHAAVDGLHERDLRPALPPQGVPRRIRTIHWAAPLLAAAAVVAVVVTSVAVSSGPQAAKHTVLPAGSLTPTPATKTPPPESTLLDFQPLWPFANIRQAREWDGHAGSQSWHLDARKTALFFAQNYLRFSDITAITSYQVTAKDAHVGVGYASPTGKPHTASVLHLIRFSDDATDTLAPWEVVGATATEFSLDTAGMAQSQPPLVTVSGRITGVDENITVAFRTLSGGVQTASPVPAGGQNSAWSSDAVRLDLRGVVTVVASTGGHVTANERFVVTGISVR